MPVLLREPRYSVLEIFEGAINFQHRKPYTSSYDKPLKAPLGIIPPFQFVKLTSAGISSIDLINYETQTAIEIKPEMLATGLEVTEYNGTGGYGDYDVWSYLGTIPLPIADLPEGVHYLRFRDFDDNYFFSGMFHFHDGIELRRDFVKIEWWSLTDLILDKVLVAGALKSTGHIRFVAPFKWYAYIDTHLIGSDWKYDETVVKRDGIPFVLTKTKYKEWEFLFPATEPFSDALSFVPLHDRIQVTYNGNTLDNINDFLPSFEKVGNGFYKALCTFKTNMTTNTVNAPGLTTTAYEVAPGGCLSDAQFCRAIVEDGTPEYDGGFVTDEFGSNRNFIDGDFLIVEAFGELLVRQAIGTNTGDYNSVTETDYSNWWANLDGRPDGLGTAGEFYFFAYTNRLYAAPFREDETIDVDVWTVTGHSFGNSLVQVILKDGSGNEWVGNTILSADFPTDGVSFGVTDNGRLATAYKFRAMTARCPFIADSEWYALEGVEYDAIEDDLIVYEESGGGGISGGGSGEEAPSSEDEGG